MVHEIFTFFEKHAKNLNAHSQKLGELGGLTAGTYSWDLQLGLTARTYSSDLQLGLTAGTYSSDLQLGLTAGTYSWDLQLAFNLAFKR